MIPAQAGILQRRATALILTDGLGLTGGTMTTLWGPEIGAAARRTQGRPVTRRPTDKEIRTVNKVLRTGRLTRDPEMRVLASGEHATQVRGLD